MKRWIVLAVMLLSMVLSSCYSFVWAHMNTPSQEDLLIRLKETFPQIQQQWQGEIKNFGLPAWGIQFALSKPLDQALISASEGKLPLYQLSVSPGQMMFLGEYKGLTLALNLTPLSSQETSGLLMVFNEHDLMSTPPELIQKNLKQRVRPEIPQPAHLMMDIQWQGKTQQLYRLEKKENESIDLLKESLKNHGWIESKSPWPQFHHYQRGKESLIWGTLSEGENTQIYLMFN